MFSLALLLTKGRRANVCILLWGMTRGVKYMARGPKTSPVAGPTANVCIVLWGVSGK